MADHDKALLDFLASLVRTVKPEVVAAAGVSAEARRVVEEAQRANGFGKLLDATTGELPRGRIDLFLCAAGHEARLRAALDRLWEHGLILLHDAEAARAMERDGLLSAVVMPTTHVLVLAQRTRS